jgi:urease accessory protein
MASVAWLDAMHMASASLPVGSFAYSDGLEQACHAGQVNDLASAQRWIGDYLQFVVARQELVWWREVWQSCAAFDGERLASAATELCALRETAELRLQSRQMAHALVAMYWQWVPGDSAAGRVLKQAMALLQQDYSAAQAALCAARGLDCELGMLAWLWSWLDNQALAAVKLVPLGQRDGQRLVHALKPLLSEAVVAALDTPLAQAASAPIGLAIASSRHETQYARLFRS